MHKTRVNRSVSGLTLFFFTIQTLLTGAPAAASEIKVQTARDSVSEYFSDLPKELASIKEVFTPESSSFDKKSPFIVQIEDAHANPEAQRHIADLIRYLAEKKGFNKVALEAATGKIHPEVLNVFPEIPAANKALAKALVDKGFITGAELYASELPNNVEFFGAEDKALYKRNLSLFRGIMNDAENTKRITDSLIARVGMVATRVVNKELLEFWREKDIRDNGNRMNAGFYGSLSTLAKEQLEIDLRDPIEQLRFPNLARIIVLTDLEKGFNREAALKEWAVFVDAVKTAAVDDKLVQELASLPAHKSDSKATRGILRDVYLKTKDVIDYSKYDLLPKLTAFMILHGEVEAVGLIEEVSRLESAIEMKLTRSREELKLSNLRRNLHLLSDLTTGRMTEEEYMEYRRNRSSHGIDGIIGEIREFENRYAKGKVSGGELDKASKSLAKLEKRALSFYRGAKLRESRVYKNASAWFGKRGVILMGGFHSKGLSQLLRKKKISYIVLSPRFGDVEKGERLYKNAILDLSILKQAEKSEVLKQFVPRVANNLVGAELATGGATVNVYGMDVPKIIPAVEETVLIDRQQEVVDALRAGGVNTPAQILPLLNTWAQYKAAPMLAASLGTEPAALPAGDFSHMELGKAQTIVKFFDVDLSVSEAGMSSVEIVRDPRPTLASVVTDFFATEGIPKEDGFLFATDKDLEVLKDIDMPKRRSNSPEETVDQLRMIAGLPDDKLPKYLILNVLYTLINRWGNEETILWKSIGDNPELLQLVGDLWLRGVKMVFVTAHLGELVSANVIGNMRFYVQHSSPFKKSYQDWPRFENEIIIYSNAFTSKARTLGLAHGRFEADHAYSASYEIPFRNQRFPGNRTLQMLSLLWDYFLHLEVNMDNEHDPYHYGKIRENHGLAYDFGMREILTMEGDKARMRGGVAHLYSDYRPPRTDNDHYRAPALGGFFDFRGITNAEVVFQGLPSAQHIKGPVPPGFMDLRRKFFIEVVAALQEIEAIRRMLEIENKASDVLAMYRAIKQRGTVSDRRHADRIWELVYQFQQIAVEYAKVKGTDVNQDNLYKSTSWFLGQGRSLGDGEPQEALSSETSVPPAPAETVSAQSLGKLNDPGSLIWTTFVKPPYDISYSERYRAYTASREIAAELSFGSYFLSDIYPRLLTESRSFAEFEAFIGLLRSLSAGREVKPSFLETIASFAGKLDPAVLQAQTDRLIELQSVLALGQPLALAGADADTFGERIDWLRGRMNDGVSNYILKFSRSEAEIGILGEFTAPLFARAEQKGVSRQNVEVALRSIAGNVSRVQPFTDAITVLTELMLDADFIRIVNTNTRESVRATHRDAGEYEYGVVTQFNWNDVAWHEFVRTVRDLSARSSTLYFQFTPEVRTQNVDFTNYAGLGTGPVIAEAGDYAVTQKQEFVVRSIRGASLGQEDDLPQIIRDSIRELEYDNKQIQTQDMADWQSYRDKILADVTKFVTAAEQFLADVSGKPDFPADVKQIEFLQIMKGIQTAIALPFVADDDGLSDRITKLWIPVGEFLEEERLAQIKAALEQDKQAGDPKIKLTDQVKGAHIIRDAATGDLVLKRLPPDEWADYSAPIWTPYLTPDFLKSLIVNLNITTDAAGDMVLPETVGNINVAAVQALATGLMGYVDLENGLRKSSEKVVALMKQLGIIGSDATPTAAQFEEFMQQILAVTLLLKTKENWAEVKNLIFTVDLVDEMTRFRQKLGLEDMRLDVFVLRLVSLKIPKKVIAQVLDNKMPQGKGYAERGAQLIAEGLAEKWLVAGGKASRWRPSLEFLIDQGIIKNEDAPEGLPRALAAYWVGGHSSGGYTGVKLSFDHLVQLSKRGTQQNLGYVLSPFTWRVFMQETWKFMDDHETKIGVHVSAQNASKAWVVKDGQAVAEESGMVLGHGNVRGWPLGAIEGLKRGIVYSIPHSADNPLTHLNMTQFQEIIGYMAQHTVAHVGVGNWRNIGQFGGGFVNQHENDRWTPNIVDTIIPKVPNSASFHAERDINIFSLFINVVNNAALLYAISPDIRVEGKPLIQWDQVILISRGDRRSIGALAKRIEKLTPEQEARMVAAFMKLMPSEVVNRKEGSNDMIQWEQLSGMLHGALPAAIAERQQEEQVKWEDPLAVGYVDISLKEYALLGDLPGKRVPLFAEVKAAPDVFAFGKTVRAALAQLVDEGTLTPEVGAVLQAEAASLGVETQIKGINVDVTAMIGSPVVQRANELEREGERAEYPTPTGVLAPRFGYKDPVDGVVSPRAEANKAAIKQWDSVQKAAGRKVLLHFGIGGQGMSNSVQVDYWGQKPDARVLVIDRLGTDMKSVFDEIEAKGFKPGEIVLDVSSKSGTTDETLILFQQALLQLILRSGTEASGLPYRFIAYLKEFNQGKDKDALFKGIDKADFEAKFTPDDRRVLQDVFSRLVFTTSLDAKASRLHAFVLGMKEILGTEIAEFDFSEYTGGRFTENSESAMTTNAWRGLDLDGMLDALKADAQQYLGEEGNDPAKNSAYKAAVLTHIIDPPFIVVAVRSANALSEALQKVQLFPESNGKDNTGSFVVPAVGQRDLDHKVRRITEETGRPPLVITIDVNENVLPGLTPLTVNDNVQLIRYVKNGISPEENARLALWFQEYTVRYGLLNAAKLERQAGKTFALPRVGAAGMNQPFIDGKPNQFSLRDPQNQPFVELAKKALVQVLTEWGEHGKKSDADVRLRYHELGTAVAAGGVVEKVTLGKNNALEKSEIVLPKYEVAARQAARRITDRFGDNPTDDQFVTVLGQIKALKAEISARAADLFEAQQIGAPARIIKAQLALERMNDELAALYAKIERYGREQADWLSPEFEATAQRLAALMLLASSRNKVFSPVFYTASPEADILGEWMGFADYGIGTRDQHANFQHRLDGKDVTFNVLVDFVLSYEQMSRSQNPVMTFGLAKDYLDGVYPDEVRRLFLEAEYRAFSGELDIDGVDTAGNKTTKRVFRDAAIVRLPAFETETPQVTNADGLTTQLASGSVAAFRLFGRARAIYQEALANDPDYRHLKRASAASLGAEGTRSRLPRRTTLIVTAAAVAGVVTSVLLFRPGRQEQPVQVGPVAEAKAPDVPKEPPVVPIEDPRLGPTRAEMRAMEEKLGTEISAVRAAMQGHFDDFVLKISRRGDIAISKVPAALKKDDQERDLRITIVKEGDSMPLFSRDHPINLSKKVLLFHQRKPGDPAVVYVTYSLFKEGKVTAASDGKTSKIAFKDEDLVTLKFTIDPTLFVENGYTSDLLLTGTPDGKQGKVFTQGKSLGKERPAYFVDGITSASTIADINQLIAQERANISRSLKAGIRAYLDAELKAGKFKEFPEKIHADTVASVLDWLTSEHIDRYTKLGILKAISAKRWAEITTAHRTKVKFGTAGPRQVAALNLDELNELREKGFQAEILKGPNTINNVTLALLTTGVARFYKSRSDEPRVSITYDSRVYGKAFADYVAAIFAKEGVQVYLFDESSPMPEMSYSVAALKLDLGILISASHNPALFNGYKVSNAVGAQLDPATRKGVEEKIYGHPKTGAGALTFADIAEVLNASANLADPQAVYQIPAGSDNLGPLVEQFSAGHPERVVVLESQERTDANGRQHVDIHNRHAAHVLSHILQPELVKEWAPRLSVIYSAFYGNGEKAFNRIAVDGLGVTNPTVVTEYNSMDGTFPRFTGRKVDGKKDGIIPDPGNSAGHAFAWELVFQDLIAQLGGDAAAALKGKDLFGGTDPDADRFGVGAPIKPGEVPEGITELLPILTKNIPPDQTARIAQLLAYVAAPELRDTLGFGAQRLLSANDTWTLILKYRIDQYAQMVADGRLPKGLTLTIAKTHVTSDAIKSLAAYAESKGLNVEIIEPYVGFSLIAEVIQKGWEEGKINIGGAEESGGFSVGGAPNVFYALVRIFETNPNALIDITADNTIQSNVTDPLLKLDSESYFGYTAAEIRETLQFLADNGVLAKQAGGFALAGKFQALASDHAGFWNEVRGLSDKAPGERLGKRGHTLEKDGLMAFVLMLEVAAVAKSQNKTVNEYLQENVYLEPLIGYFAGTNQSLEFDNTVGGLAEKISVIKNALELARKVKNGDEVIIDGKKVLRAEIFVPSAPKYTDAANFPASDYTDLVEILAEPELRATPSKIESFFPEEGIRFHFADGSHLTIRPSGTENKIRFYVQWKVEDVSAANLTARMLEGDKIAYGIANAAKVTVQIAQAASLGTGDVESQIRELLKAPGRTVLVVEGTLNDTLPAATHFLNSGKKEVAVLRVPTEGLAGVNGEMVTDKHAKLLGGMTRDEMIREFEALGGSAGERAVRELRELGFIDTASWGEEDKAPLRDFIRQTIAPKVLPADVIGKIKEFETLRFETLKGLGVTLKVEFKADGKDYYFYPNLHPNTYLIEVDGSEREIVLGGQSPVIPTDSNVVIKGLGPKTEQLWRYVVAGNPEGGLQGAANIIVLSTNGTVPAILSNVLNTETISDRKLLVLGPQHFETAAKPSTWNIVATASSLGSTLQFRNEERARLSVVSPDPQVRQTVRDLADLSDRFSAGVVDLSDPELTRIALAAGVSVGDLIAAHVLSKEEAAQPVSAADSPFWSVAQQAFGWFFERFHSQTTPAKTGVFAKVWDVQALPENPADLRTVLEFYAAHPELRVRYLVPGLSADAAARLNLEYARYFNETLGVKVDAKRFSIESIPATHAKIDRAIQFNPKKDLGAAILAADRALLSDRVSAQENVFKIQEKTIADAKRQKDALLLQELEAARLAVVPPDQQGKDFSWREIIDGERLISRTFETFLQIQKMVAERLATAA